MLKIRSALANHIKDPIQERVVHVAVLIVRRLGGPTNMGEVGTDDAMTYPAHGRERRTLRIVEGLA